MPALPPLYLITDRQQITAGRQFLDVVEELLQAGVRMLQLREKDLSAAELYPLAIKLRALTRQHNCLMLINDRVDLAMAVGADGVHLGGHSLPTLAVRRLLGPDKLIGVSTHAPQEILTAAKQGADFATFGPVFHTASKAAYGDPVGIEKLHQACNIRTIPVYALGGIKLENTLAVKQAGANGIAMISALLCANSPAATCQKFFEKLNN